MNIRKTITRLGRAFRTPDHQKIVRNYLDRSVSMADLERRQREIDQGKFSSF